MEYQLLYDLCGNWYSDSSGTVFFIGYNQTSGNIWLNYENESGWFEFTGGSADGTKYAGNQLSPACLVTTTPCPAEYEFSIDKVFLLDW